MDANQSIEKYKHLMLFIVMVIMITGMIMVYSSSYIHARELYGSSFYYLARQMVFACIGILLAFVLSKTKRTFWQKYAREINMAMTVVLLLTLLPPVGIAVKGAHRWIGIFGLTFQPGEFAKITMALSAICFFENFEKLDRKSNIIHAVSLLVPLLIFVFQPDFGTFSICFILIAFICFISDFPRRIFSICLGTGILLSIPILLSRSYRVERIFSFLDPWKNARGSGFQIIQSYLAFAGGSVFGLGLGNSNEKLFYLPEAHNDFIFSVLGEETGFVGVCFVVLVIRRLGLFWIQYSFFH